MSRAYVERRLREINAQHAVAESIAVDGNVILWSLDAGCWMLVDGERGTCQPLTEIPTPTVGASTDE